MADETEGPKDEAPPTIEGDKPQPEQPEAPPRRRVNLRGPHIEAFVEIRVEAYLEQAAILTAHFIGGGDKEKSRREFMRMSMETFDAVASEYERRSMTKNINAFVHRRPSPPEEGPVL